MRAADLYAAYEAVADDLEAHWDDQGSTEFRSIVARLRGLAEAGCVEAAAALAEVLALPGPLHDAADAYRWYFIAYSTGSYSTEFRQVQEGPKYCGPVGDFRNEAVVSALVDALGFERVRELDADAAAWLREHVMRFTDPRDDRTT